MSDHVNYRGDHTAFDPDHLMGPDMFGARYCVTGADYNAETDVTALTLTAVPPAQQHERILGEIANFRDSARIAALFGGKL